MDPLTQLLVQRQMNLPNAPQPISPGVSSAPPQTSIPTQTALPAVPPNVPAKVPPQAKRWVNAQAIQDAYRGNWTPNPVLLRAQLGRR
jgi:hypothetical protein